MKENNFIRKLGLIAKLITSLTGKLTITTNLLTNISRSKSNQTILQFN